MKVSIKMIYMKERQYIIIKMEIYMKAILKKIKEKEKGYFIIIMEIEKWVII